MNDKRRNESGQALVMVLLALMLGILLISGFLYYASTSQRATQATQGQTIDRYSADAGVEDALWKLTNQAITVTAGTTYTYTITINGQTVVVTITNPITP